MFGFVSKKRIDKVIDSYIQGVQSDDEVELPISARYFDWETPADIRNSLRDLRKMLTGTDEDSF